MKKRNNYERNRNRFFTTSSRRFITFFPCYVFGPSVSQLSWAISTFSPRLVLHLYGATLAGRSYYPSILIYMNIQLVSSPWLFRLPMGGVAQWWKWFPGVGKSFPSRWTWHLCHQSHHQPTATSTNLATRSNCEHRIQGVLRLEGALNIALAWLIIQKEQILQQLAVIFQSTMVT